jgi:flagellar biosynthesis/type III secretory pathway protein FliH
LSTDADRNALRVELPARPASAKLAPGGDGALEAWIQRRVAAARTAGVEEGARQASTRAAKALEAACVRLDEARERAAEALSRNAVQLAVEIARALVRSEIEAGRHGLEAIVREALAASGVGRGACVVHLNPLDAASLADVKFRTGTTIEPDESVARGDVQVSTPQGLLVREMHEALRSVHERLLAESQ